MASLEGKNFEQGIAGCVAKPVRVARAAATSVAEAIIVYRSVLNGALGVTGFACCFTARQRRHGIGTSAEKEVPIMRCPRCFALVCLLAGCAMPATRMEPTANYGARLHPTVSGQPAYTAGPTYQVTYSPDGSTLFVCDDGSTAPGWSVTPGATPAC
jgi:hypothetical protein